MAPKAKAKTRAEQMAENDRLVRERDEANAEAVAARRAVDGLARQLDVADSRADNLREALAEHAEDAARWRARAERWRETCDRLRFALDVVRERDELRAKGGAS